MTPKNTNAFLLLALLLHDSYRPSSCAPRNVGKDFKDVQFATPLKSMTFSDETSPRPAPRASFLRKFKKGLEYERDTRLAILGEERRRRKIEEEGVLVEDEPGGVEYESSEWAEYAEALEEKDREKKLEGTREAFEKGFASAGEEGEGMRYGDKAKNAYQFVGVVGPHRGNKVKWYAREKPAKSDWSVRLVHVDQAAVLRDLFVRGKIDIYGKYENKGVPPPALEGEELVQTSGAVIRPAYEAKERSWKTLWNFSPRHFFADRSGMYWRERRIRPGIYTDGLNVYESTFRYVEGKNGMKKLGLDLTSYLDKFPGVDGRKILQKVNASSPDVVSEF